MDKNIYIALAILLVTIISLSIAVFRMSYNIVNEIKESRTREDLLLQEVKLLDYQINVLTNQVLGEK